MILVNGEERGYIASNDRGFHYGDGLFETIGVINGKALFLEQHLNRLEQGCSRLRIPKPDYIELKNEIQRACGQEQQAVVKIIITRGPGGRGYRQPDPVLPTRVISLHPYPDFPKDYAELGINARFCETRLGLNPALAGIKHLNRLEQVLARAEWDDPEQQEGIMLDIDGRVIEGTMSNLFYAKDNILYTATLKSAGVAGVMRGILMGLMSEHGLSCIEHSFDKETLLDADEVFVCNSIIGIWPVKRIEAKRFTLGSLTQRLQQWLARHKAKELENV